MSFSSLIYTFNSAEVAQAWNGDLSKILGDKVAVMVGDQDIEVALAQLNQQASPTGDYDDDDG